MARRPAHRTRMARCSDKLLIASRCLGITLDTGRWRMYRQTASATANIKGARLPDSRLARGAAPCGAPASTSTAYRASLPWRFGRRQARHFGANLRARSPFSGRKTAPPHLHHINDARVRTPTTQHRVLLLALHTLQQNLAFMQTLLPGLRLYLLPAFHSRYPSTPLLCALSIWTLVQIWHLLARALALLFFPWIHLVEKFCVLAFSRWTHTWFCYAVCIYFSTHCYRSKRNKLQVKTHYRRALHYLPSRDATPGMAAKQRQLAGSCAPSRPHLLRHAPHTRTAQGATVVLVLALA